MIRAHIALKGPRGSATTESHGPMTDVKGYVAGAATREEVRESLEQLGFSVCRVSGLSITVEAPVATFEKVFGARLNQVDVGQPPPDEQTAGESAPEERLAWAWAEPPRMPNRLENTVDTVVFPQPTRKMTGAGD